MTPSQQAALEQVAREWLDKQDWVFSPDLATDQDRVDTVITLLAVQRAAVLAEAAIFWDTMAEGPWKDQPDFEYAFNFAYWLRQRAQEQRP